MKAFIVASANELVRAAGIVLRDVYCCDKATKQETLQFAPLRATPAAGQACASKTAAKKETLHSRDVPPRWRGATNRSSLEALAMHFSRFGDHEGPR